MNGPSVSPGGAQAEKADQHEQDVENREAYQYWGYLFKPDKTGSDRLKSLLRGLKDVMNEHHEPYDSPDLTPTQLASFYRELHGNYDQLFLGTPSESIAFIYKSLGCLHSLQPLSHSTAFTDPTVPALKTEGWIMWQTIQLLLGPEEHSSFLMEAVQKWDVKDPQSGEVFPKILPRQCFPVEPDKHMVAWYEGVSERLRREAEEEEHQRDIEAEQAEQKRLHPKKEEVEDDEGSVDSRGPALAYFRNPLFRHVDGRPSIVRRNSKRPQLSPRPTVIDKGKGAATTMGHVIRNIGSPHLWDGRHPSKSQSRERDRYGKRRTSLPDNRYSQPSEPPTSAGYDASFGPGYSKQSRRRSGQVDHPPSGSSGEDEPPPGVSPRPGSHYQSHQQSADERDPTIRHSRSHEPTPSQKEYPDYFHGFDDPSRRNSTYDSASPAPSANGVGPSFGPSASPLFASHVAKQPQPAPPPQPRFQSGEQWGPPRKAPSVRRAQERPYSRSPDPSSRHRDDRDRDSRHHSSRDRRPRYEQSPSRMHDDSPHTSQPGFPPMGPPPDDHGRRGSGAPSQGHLPGRDRRSHRYSGSDASAYSGAEDRDRDRDRRSSRPKQTRFSAGVDGRRYPNETPWRS
ncbi:uncharacterized protein LTR77_008697 [Saxophila tyrrhenica]|uniref:DUF7514 domain-containing protein n=1 Tax=Saxophila tyrrhenica TaxID=1690608 RepID=A0AAV9P0N3_9PEZI|nr:hypothetical protein LTR77_008697 [Saxophila tyrrhenica]